MPPSAFSRRFAGVVIAVLVAHGLLLAGLDRLERAPAQAKPFEEIAVDLVTSEAPKPSQEEKPKDEKAQEQKIQQQKVQEQKSQEASPPEQKAPEEKPKEEAAKPEPAKAAEAKAEETKPSEARPQAAPPPEPPKDAAKQEPAKQEPEQEPPKTEPPQQEPEQPAAKTVAKGAGREPAARTAAAATIEAVKPMAPKTGPVSPPATPADEQGPAGLAALEGTRSIPSGYHFLPDDFRVLAVPQSSANGEDRLPYSTLVFSRLELSKHYPEAARARKAQGAAGVGFTLDDKGNVLDVKLLVPSGDKDLDKESVAMVRRAAPFPPPPPGERRHFDMIVTFRNTD